jgi:AraC family transcriptional regulator
LVFSVDETALGLYLKKLSDSFDPVNATIGMERDTVFFELARYILLLQKSFLKSGNLDSTKYSTRVQFIERLNIAKEVLSSEKGPVDIATVARQSMLSPAHLFRGFKKLFGITPYQYLMQCRLERSLELLKNAELNILDIALVCGFADAPSYSKAFKKLFGRSPQNFREKAVTDNSCTD